MKDRRICKVPCACRPILHSVIISFYSDTVTHGVDVLVPYTYMDGQSGINLCMHAIIAFCTSTVTHGEDRLIPYTLRT